MRRLAALGVQKSPDGKNLVAAYAQPSLSLVLAQGCTRHISADRCYKGTIIVPVR